MNRRQVVAWLILSMGSAAWAGEPDLSSPRRALHTFLDSARGGDFAAASGVLDLRGLPEGRRAADGPRLARELLFVLDRELWPDLDRISDDPAGDPDDGPGADVLGTIPLGASRIPIRLVRAEGAWRFGPGVVTSIPALYSSHGPGWIGERVPAALIELQLLDVQAWQWIGLTVGLGLALFVALGLGALARQITLRVVRRTRIAWDDLLVESFSAPVRLLLGLATFAAATRALHLAAPPQEVLDQALRIVAVAIFTLVGLRAIRFGASVLAGTVSARGAEPAARSRLTQVMVMRRIAGVVVIVVGGALVFLQFDALRALGTSLLASAGVAGLVLGLAAQRTIATLLAGLQISLTQPLRVGDVVVIEGEWGTIEEITLTYVVVKVWDLRRLVVPITKILDSSFQNWTRAGSDILGTVFLHADYRLPVGVVRKELERFVTHQRAWDGKVVGLQVTDATERTVQLRALVSSADASANWDLRCAVREHLLSFIQQLEAGAYLPRTRLESSGTPPARSGAPQSVPSRTGEV